MLKKLMTGFGVALGAGVALHRSTRNNAKRGATLAGSGAIRVHTTRPATVTSELMTGREFARRATELAKIRAILDAIEKRGGESTRSVNQRIDDLQNLLPHFIDVKINAHLRETEDLLRSDFEKEEAQTVDVFLRTLETKILPRLSFIEGVLETQGSQIIQLSQRLDDTDRMLTRVNQRMEQSIVEQTMVEQTMKDTSQVVEIHQKAVA